MQGLLPENIIQELLQSTGAYGESKQSRLVATGNFKKYNFQQKKKSEFDIAVFESALDIVKNKIQEDWRVEFYQDCLFVRNKAEIKDLAKYKFRDESYCCQFKSNLFPDSFFIYIGRDTFFFLLNQYLGGSLQGSEKASTVLTDIEAGVLEQISKRLTEYFEHGLKNIHEMKLSFVKVPLSEAEQKPDLKNDFLVSELEFPAKNKSYKVALALPTALLNLLKEQQQSGGGGDQKKKLDPIWQKVVTEACLNSQVDLIFQFEKLNISFGQSLSLKVGDVLPWQKNDNIVSVFYNDDLRLQGAIGIVDGNFAVRVDDTY